MQYNNSQEGPGGNQPQRRPGQQPPRRPTTPGAPQRRPAIAQQPDRGRRPEQPERKPPAPKVQNRWFRAIVMVLATISGCVFLAFFILQSANDLFGLNQKDQTYTVEIPKGASVSDVAKILTDVGVVDQSFTFNLYAGLKSKDKPFQPGKYVFNSNMGYDQIIAALRTGNNVKEEVRVTLYEGDTLWDIALSLEKKNVCDAQEFVDYLGTADFDYEFMNALPESNLRYHRLEGYIFPDTYDFFVGESVADVAKKFLRNFNEKITDELQAQMQELNLTLDEAITLASIIQREAKEEEDMRIVSSVFYNRLENSVTYPNLQSDVTIFYVNENIKPNLLQSNQDMYDAYNTYVRTGLPVGPICNPGLVAIKAALNPDKTDYYFFVTDKEERFYYSATSNEHYKNIAAAKAVGGEAHGVDTLE